jgi:hypothetical protein
MRRSFGNCLVMLVFGLVAAAGFAQDASLVVGANKTVVDGAIKADEYSFTKDFGSLALFANRTADTLYLAVDGKTSGWVAVGLSSLKMNGATIFMGFVGGDGKVQFKPQTGSGHSHSGGADVGTTIVSYAIKEANGRTTLELALKADAYLSKGQATLDLIFAVGPEKSFSPRHTYRGALSLKL